ncbi:MAG: tRNA pseudouridine(55) synthase TruB [Deltaproteobacteria bacterium]|nr:tRNA pseudouridine(55) synthase TruB [Deltaproteobacteria bacterium]
MNGILLIDKPVDLTSADVVRRVKRRLPRAVKVGHLGTLDPFATGLLPLCLGEATKIAQFLNTADKRYSGVIRLGVATDTGDRTGREQATAPLPALREADLAAVAAHFTGDLQQRPPMYSALKRDGVPLYRLARRGIEVERELRAVRVDGLVLAVDGPDRLRFSLGCSKGTYVRVLAEDIGTALGTVAHLAELRRTGFGGFDIGDAVALDAWDPGCARGLIGLRAALAHLPALAIDQPTAAAARQGKAAVLGHLPGAPQAAALLIDPAGEVAAVVVREQGTWRYGRVLAPPQALHGTDTVVADTVE